MRWLRSNTGGVAWLALFALVCQLVISFGHVHIGNANTGSAWAALANAGKATDSATSRKYAESCRNNRRLLCDLREHKSRRRFAHSCRAGIAGASFTYCRIALA